MRIAGCTQASQFLSDQFGQLHMRSASCSRADEFQLRIVSAIPPGIPRQQQHTLYGSMGPDVEVRQRRGAGALGAAVLQEGLAGEKAGVPRQLQPGEDIGRQSIIQRLDALEPYRDLGVDDGIDA